MSDSVPPAGTKPEDRRKTRRKSLVVYLRVFDMDSGEVLGYLADINEHGVLLLSQQPIPAGRDYVLELSLFEDAAQLDHAAPHYHLRAQSRWSRPLNSQLHGTGFMLTDLSPRRFASVNEVMEALERHHWLLETE